MFSILSDTEKEKSGMKYYEGIVVSYHYDTERSSIILSKLKEDLTHLEYLIKLEDLIHLTTLKIYNNRWYKMPKLLSELLSEIGKLTQLTILYLSKNRLCTLPGEIGLLTQLTTLDLCINQLTKLPVEILHLTQLSKLDVSDNKLTKLPGEIGLLTKLTKLYVRDNRLLNLPGEIGLLTQLTTLVLSYNQLKQLPGEIVLLTKLTKLHLSNNQLTELPDEIGLLTNLTKLYLCSNQFTEIPIEIWQLTTLSTLYLSNNQLTEIPIEIWQLTRLSTLYLSNNQLTELPDEIRHLTQLSELDLSYNQLLNFPENIFFPNLKEFICDNNNLTSLPLFILRCNQLRQLDYHDNPIELSPQIARFLDRYETRKKNKLIVYEDTQNVHDSNIQTSVRDSINNITTRTDVSKYDKDELHQLIFHDNILTPLCKEQLIEYSDDLSVHSLVLLTFPEVLWFVLQTIHKDFSIEIQNEIKKILNDEMKEANCKCFTGRMNRSVNCLNGFSDLVKINIKDSDQIANIIFLVQEQMEKKGEYTIERHKEIVSKELTERGYDNTVITEWIGFIE